MTDAERVWATPQGVILCALDSIPDPGARGFVLQMRAGRFHGFAVRRGEKVWGYADRCPHAGLPLAATLDAYLTKNRRLIACTWHGALFEPETGLCVGGPCAGRRLTPWPLAVVDGSIVTA